MPDFNRKTYQFRVGDFVQHSQHWLESNEFSPNPPFVGEVIRLAVNATGEPVLHVRMTIRKIRRRNTVGMQELDWHPVEYMNLYEDDAEFFEKIAVMHPSNLEPLCDGTTI